MKLGVMCSGNGTNFENIVRTCREDEVVLMIHNKEKCGAVKRADKLGIPHCYIHHKNEDNMVELFKAWRVDLIILAGYMRVLKNPSAFHCPIINVHPSLLPKYKGLNVVQKAMDAGARLRRKKQRQEYALKISGSEDNVPDDIRDHKNW